MTETPGAFFSAARACASVIGFSNSMFTASAWPMKDGTRTQVAVTSMPASMIFLVSTTIFHSSLVDPSSMKTSMWGMTLKAICLVNLCLFLVIGSLTNTPRVWLNSSSMPSLPAPDVD